MLSPSDFSTRSSSFSPLCKIASIVLCCEFKRMLSVTSQMFSQSGLGAVPDSQILYTNVPLQCAGGQPDARISQFHLQRCSANLK